jgi:hypothetical protein
MTGAQILAIAITVLAVPGGTLVNNSRTSDINNRLGDVKEVLHAEFRADIGQLRSALTATMETRFSSIDRKAWETTRPASQPSNGARTEQCQGAFPDAQPDVGGRFGL